MGFIEYPRIKKGEKLPIRHFHLEELMKETNGCSTAFLIEDWQRL